MTSYATTARWMGNQKLMRQELANHKFWWFLQNFSWLRYAKWWSDLIERTRFSSKLRYWRWTDSKLSMTLLLIKLDLVFRRCRFVTQIGDFSYVKLQHECSSFSLTLKMRQNYILDEAKDGQINFAVLTVPSHCRIKILLFRNHWSERGGRFATPQMYVIFSTALISKGNTWKTSAKEVRNVIIWIGWNSWWIVYFWESATHVTGKRRRFFIFNHIHKRGGTSHKISVMSRAELGGHWASPSRAFYKLFLCYTNEPTSRAKTVPSHEFSLVTSQVVT